VSGDEEAVAPRRSLRDRPLGRIAMLVAVLVVAAAAARSCADTTPDVSQDEAVEIAMGVATFEPEDHQIRFLRQGVPSRGLWVVSLYQGDPRQPTKVQVVTIDSETGEIVDEDA
jgi:hypothetical protein